MKYVNWRNVESVSEFQLVKEKYHNIQDRTCNGIFIKEIFINFFIKENIII